MVDIKEITKIPIVRNVSIALAINLLLAYVVNNDIPDFMSIIVALGIIGGVAFMLRNQFLNENPVNHFIAGSLSYAAYIGALMFFKLTQETPQIANEITSILIFGGLTAGVLMLQQKFGK